MAIDEIFDVEPKFECTDQLPQITNLSPELERWSKELQEDIKRGEATLLYCSDKTEAELHDYYVRKLLKCRVKRIMIDTWEK